MGSVVYGGRRWSSLGIFLKFDQKILAQKPFFGIIASIVLASVYEAKSFRPWLTAKFRPGAIPRKGGIPYARL